MDVFFPIGIAGMIILLGSFMFILSKKIHYPLMVFLLGFGIIIGPVTGIFNPYSFQTIIHSFVTIALIIVLFEVGYNTKLTDLKQNLIPSVWLTLLGIFFSVILCAIAAKFILHLGVLHSLLFGALLASTDLTIVAPLLEHINIIPKLKTYLELESSLNSVVAAIIAIIIINILEIGFEIEGTIKLFLTNIFVGIGLGVVFGFVILKLVQSLNIEEKPHIISIGSVILVYAIAEFFSASGILAALVIGLIFGNAKPQLPKIVYSFGGELQLILLAFVYVLLGAFLKFEFF
ncbi:hypothetical protein DRJ22_05610, partial [Candidatus Woesearchaeota archaeon]